MSEVHEEKLNTAYIGLGSNLGEREENLRRALALLRERGVIIEKISSFLRTEPYGVKDQPWFLNAVCAARTNLQPEKFLQLLLGVEQEMGRVRLRHWGERNIDLDLLLYEDAILQTPSLTLPHPDMQNREFVLRPLAEIAPQAVHPVLKKDMKELLAMLLARKE